MLGDDQTIESAITFLQSRIKCSAALCCRHHYRAGATQACERIIAVSTNAACLSATTLCAVAAIACCDTTATRSNCASSTSTATLNSAITSSVAARSTGHAATGRHSTCTTSAGHSAGSTS